MKNANQDKITWDDNPALILVDLVLSSKISVNESFCEIMEKMYDMCDEKVEVIKEQNK